MWTISTVRDFMRKQACLLPGLYFNLPSVPSAPFSICSSAWLVSARIPKQVHTFLLLFLHTPFPRPLRTTEDHQSTGRYWDYYTEARVRSTWTDNVMVLPMYLCCSSVHNTSHEESHFSRHCLYQKSPRTYSCFKIYINPLLVYAYMTVPDPPLISGYRL